MLKYSIAVGASLIVISVTTPKGTFPAFSYMILTQPAVE